jgi:hypothetical protein
MISSGAHAECLRLLELLTNKRVQESWSWVFMTPVQIPGYQDVIKKPMDLGTVKKNLGSKPSRCRFKSHEKFAKDVRLVFQNALLYNKDDEHVKGSVYDAAQHLLRVFETAYAKSQESVFKKEDSYEMPQEQESTGLSGVESSSKQLDVFDDVKKKLKKSKKKSKSSDPADVQSSAVNTEPSMEDKFPTEADKKLSTKAVETMSEENISACLDILMKLIKYKEGNISPAAPFLQPVDLNHFPDYKIKIPHRMHLYGVQKKLKNGGYADFDAFAHDVRLIFSNCLVYNSDVLLSKTIRNHAVTLMKLFEAQFSKIGGSWKGIPDRWKCHHILQEILAVRVDGLEVAQWFKYPIQVTYT